MTRDDHAGAFRTAPNRQPHAGLYRITYPCVFKGLGPLNGVVHNHPSGDPAPSRADIEMTQAIIAIARPLGIAVHDHLIVGKDGHASLKAMKLI